MSKEDLQLVIDNFSDDNLNRFFRRSCDDYAENPEDLSQYDEEGKITGFRRLGEIDFGNTERLLVTTARANTELTERSGKKAQYEKAKKMLKEAGIYDAGFFVFYDDSGSFRFSLIYGQAEGTKKSWSNFRRFTYFVSSDQTNITFKKRVGECGFTSLDTIKDAFSVEKVTKDFYKQIADWYFWAVKNVKFPEAAENEENGRNIAVIRLITRLIFIWFMKERKLVSPDLFNKNKMSALLKSLKSDETTYYKAILQNLFFATLNTKIEDRKFRFTSSFQGKNADYMDHGIYRYEDYFNNQEDMLAVFKDIPFLNGGLFDCLDWAARESGTGKEVRFDGFSDKEVGLKMPNYLFFSEDREADLNKDYGTKNRKYRVQGLLNILSAYNFTIDENDPNDQEVALDPELLGKVFENLLASFNPETATTARKATGSYYTPREIVDYMVTQSLKQYYKTHLDEIDDIDSKLDELLSPVTDEPDNPFNEDDSRRVAQLTEELRIVDPAVGSGAFPMGILNKLVSVLSRVDRNNTLWKEAQLNAVKDFPEPAQKRQFEEQIKERFFRKSINYLRKLYLIQKCIYGVDIQPIAIEIARLRFFIALLVDEDIDKNNPDNQGIEPLPNLDFKLMQGNSLISEFMGINLDSEDSDAPARLMKDETDELISRYQDKKSEFQYEPDRKKKEALKSEIETLIEQIFESKLKTQKTEYYTKLKNIERKYASVPDIEQRNEAIRKDTETLNRNYKFDLTQAERQLKEFTTGLKIKPFFAWKLYFAEVFHEKGGFDIVIANPPYIKEYVNRKAFDGVRNSPYYMGKMDIWYLFACQCIDYLKDGGVFTFIAQNNWVTSYGASKLRNKVVSDTRIHALLDFGDYKVFESSGIQTMVMVFQKEKETDDYTFDYRRITNGTVVFKDILDLLNYRENVNVEYLTPRIQREVFANNTLTFSDSRINGIIEKVRLKANFCLTEHEIAQGIVPNPDVVNTRNINKIPPNKISRFSINVGDGVFVINKGMFGNINEIERKYIKPLYEPSLMSKYYISSKNEQEIIYITKHNFQNDCPNILNHLQKYKEIMDERRENLEGKLKYYHLHWPRNPIFFKQGPKILSIRKCVDPTFIYTELETYVMMAVNVIKTERINLKYLTAILNSKLIAFWLRHKGKMQGDNYQIDKEPLLAIPIYMPSNEDQQSIVKKVDQILSIGKEDGYPDNPDDIPQIKEIEHQIDRLVYELYGLTEEEKAVVEGNRTGSNDE